MLKRGDQATHIAESQREKTKAMTNTIINWLNDEPEAIILQRDDAFAMLTWKDFNQQPEAFFDLSTIACLGILLAGVPILLMS